MPDRETTTETLEEEKQPRQTALAAPAVLTIDLEDYYQVSAFKGTVRPEDWSWYPSRVERNVERLLDMLDEYNVKATWFTLGWEASRRGAITSGLVWNFARPPVIGLDYEMDVRGTARELIL